MSGVQAPGWLHASLVDPDVTDICLNGTDLAFIDRGDGMQPLALANGTGWNEETMRSWVIGLLSAAGKTWDAKLPFIDATLEITENSGAVHRLHVAFPPLSRAGIAVSLRRLPRTNLNRPGFLNDGSSMHASAERWRESSLFPQLADAVARGESILVSGATGAGKTTLLNDLLAFAPPNERIIALEDTPELSPQHPHFISLVSRAANSDGFGEVTLRMLLRQALRMRPNRIVLGECRGSEVLELLQALNTGHCGTIATLHANSPRDALRRVELLCLLSSGGTVPIGVLRELLCHGIRWVAQAERQGRVRKITELWRVEGKEGDTLLLRPTGQG